jgi:hypothetical protein
VAKTGLALAILRRSRSSLLGSATAQLGGVAPYHYADYITNRMLYAGADVGTVAGGTGYSFTRASDGYYTNSDGTLTLFGSGALRRGDRGVLIEGSRTNLLTYSQEFDNASWTKSGSTVTANATTAPDGTVTADALVENTALSNHQISQSFTASAVTYAFSAFVKANGRTNVQLQIRAASDSGTEYAARVFDLSAAPSNTASSFMEALGNGWFRLTVFGTAVAGTRHCIIRPIVGGTSNYTGDGTSGIFIWGAQLEAASFASSYIPTVAAAATRAADVLTYTAGVSYPVSLWAEFERVVDTGANANLVYADDGSSNNFTRLIVGGDSDALVASMFSGGADQGPSTSAATISTGLTVKGSARFNTNSIRACLAGTLATEDTVATLAATPTTIYIGSARFGQFFFGYIRRAAIFNSALTDAQLTTTTS